MRAPFLARTPHEKGPPRGPPCLELLRCFRRALHPSADRCAAGAAGAAGAADGDQDEGVGAGQAGGHLRQPVQDGRDDAQRERGQPADAGAVRLSDVKPLAPAPGIDDQDVERGDEEEVLLLGVAERDGAGLAEELDQVRVLAIADGGAVFQLVAEHLGGGDHRLQGQGQRVSRHGWAPRGTAAPHLPVRRGPRLLCKRRAA